MHSVLIVAGLIFSIAFSVVIRAVDKTDKFCRKRSVVMIVFMVFPAEKGSTFIEKHNPNFVKTVCI